MTLSPLADLAPAVAAIAVGSTLRRGKPPPAASAWSPELTILQSNNRRFR